MIDQLWSGQFGYTVVFVVCAFCGLAYPVPEDVPLLFVGVQLADGRLDWGPTLAAAISGVLVRDMLAYSIGRAFGDRILASRRLAKVLPIAKIEAARARIAERGPIAVMLGRILVGFRVPTFIAAGASGVPLTAFVVWDGLGLLLTTTGLLAAGAWFGPPIVEAARSILPWAPVLVVAVLLAFAARYVWQRRAQASGDQT